MMPAKSKLRLIIHNLLLMLASVACVPEYVPPDDYKDFSTWRSAVSDAQIKSSFKMLGHANEIVMCVQRKKGQEYFTGLNVNNGKVLWQTLVPNGDSVAVADAYIHGSSYIFYADGKLRNINLQNGQYTWENSEYNVLVPDITGLGEHFYFSAQSKTEPRLGAIFKGNTTTGQIEELVVAPYTDSLAISSLSGIIGCAGRVDAVDMDGKTILIVQSTYRRDSRDEIVTRREHLGMYNTQNKSWEWNIISLAFTEIHPVFYRQFSRVGYFNGMIFTNERTLYYNKICLNAANAEVIWEENLYNSFRDIVIVNDEMVFFVGNSLDIHRLSDGEPLWNESGGFPVSKINVHKSVVYLATNNYGFAYKATTGRPYWNIRLLGPTHRKNNNLKGECVVVPTGDDAMVIYTSDLEVYAYKALNP
jgi:outer membrane protein assembly factor BamB